MTETLTRAARNVPWLSVELPGHASVYQVLRNDRLVFEKAALLTLQEALGGLVAIAEAWPEAPRHLVDVFLRRWYENLLAEAFATRAPLAGFDGRGHEHAIGTFCDLDRRVLRHNRARLALEHWQRLPRHEGGGQLTVLRREFEKKKTV